VEEEIFPDKPGRLEVAAGFLRRQFHQGRGGRAKLAISTSVIARVVSTVISLLILPITVRYLGNEGYGLMVTISSVVGWLQFTNMGIGLGLQNALTEETARANRQRQAELVSTAIFSLAGIGLILLGVGLISFPLVDWLKVFPPTTGRFSGEIPWSVLIVFFGFVSTIALGFLGPIYAARQELHLGSIQAIAISLLTLAGTLAAVHFRWGLIGIVSSTIGLTALMQWAFALWTLYGRGIRELRPRFSAISSSAWLGIYKTGLSFLLLQLCNIAFYGMDAFLITHFLSVNQVTPYSVAQKVFLQTAGIFAIITGSLWAAYGNAKALGDVAWIRRTHGRMVKLFFLFFGGLTIFMIFFGHNLLAWWLGPAAAPPTLLIAAVAAYFCTREWTGLHAMLLNGLDVVRPQVSNLVITAILTLALDLLLVRRLGPLGLALGGLFGFAVAGAWYLPLLTSRELAKLSKATSSSPEPS
jgi:O-antigen/teichoic acid export membrane protein